MGALLTYTGPLYVLYVAGIAGFGYQLVDGCESIKYINFELCVVNFNP